MKKLIAFAMVMGIVSSLSASMSYECWRYVGGSPQGYIKITASSKGEAQSKAADKFADMGKKVDYVKCK